MPDVVKGIFSLLVILTVLVVVHEWGHFAAARFFKMRVEDFSIFFGKILFRIGKRGDTEFNVRSIPIGGFVKVAGMELDDISAGKPILQAIRSGAADTGGMDALLERLTADTMAEIDPDNIGPTVRSIITTAIGVDNKLTQAGREEIEAMLNSTKISADEKTLLEMVLASDAKQNDPGLYSGRPIYQRAIVIFGGPFASLAFGYLLFCVLFMSIGEPVLTTTIGTVTDDGVAKAAGLKEGERITAVDGSTAPNWKFVVEKIHDSAEKPITLTVESAGKTRDVTLTPKASEIEDGGKKVKMGLIGIAPKEVYEKRGFIASMGLGTDFTVNYVRTLLGTLFSKHAKDSVGGPIAMGQITTQVQKQGFVALLRLGAIFSISLGVINLMPVPILDGGHLMFLAMEKLRRKKMSPREIYRAQMVGLGVLLLLFAFVMVNDISRLVTK